MPCQLLVVMGPSGCGKSSVGVALAEAVDAPMLEGDDFHSQANRTKMAAGHALTDNDRADWLDRIEGRLKQLPDPQVVLACSALTSYAQERLRAISSHHARFIFLDAPRHVLARRMEARSNHFMPVSLLESQIGALLVPDDAIVVDAQQSTDWIVARIVSALDHEAQQ